MGRETKIFGIIFVLTIGLTACGDEQLGSQQPADPSKASVVQLAPEQGERARVLNAVGPVATPKSVSITTDKKAYLAPATVVATLHNSGKQSVFAAGCTAFSREENVGGKWIDRGADHVCVWEGLAVEIKAGQGTHQGTIGIKDPGTWRIKARIGRGCKAGLPLSQASCASLTNVFSAAFKVGVAPAPAVKVYLDKKIYRQGEDAFATVENHLTESVFLAGCTQVSRQQLVGKTWLDKGRMTVCVWEGYAVEVASGAAFTEQSSVRFDMPGTWRVVASYGKGCSPKKPLSGCKNLALAVSPPVHVAK